MNTTAGIAALAARVAQLERQVAQLARAGGNEALQPNYLTVNPDGTTSALFTGGVLLNETPAATPYPEGSITWRSVNGKTDAQGDYPAQIGAINAGPNNPDSLGINVSAVNSEVATIDLGATSLAGIEEQEVILELNAQPTTGASKITVTALHAGTRTILADDGSSDFARSGLGAAVMEIPGIAGNDYYGNSWIIAPTAGTTTLPVTVKNASGSARVLALMTGITGYAGVSGAYVGQGISIDDASGPQASQGEWFQFSEAGIRASIGAFATIFTGLAAGPHIVRFWLAGSGAAGQGFLRVINDRGMGIALELG